MEDAAKNTTFTNTESNCTNILAVVQSVFLAFTMVISAVANGVICHCILANRSLRTITNSFIFNLAATDFLLSVLCIPFSLVSAISRSWVFGRVMCILTGFLLSVLCIASILTLALVAVERYLAICRPFRYCSNVTRKSCAVMILSVWTLASVFAILPVLGWGRGYSFVEDEYICRPKFGRPTEDNGYTMFLFAVCFSVPFAIIAYAYVSILLTARRQFRRVHHARPNVINVRPNNSDITCNETPFVCTSEHATIADEFISRTNSCRVKKLYSSIAVRNRQKRQKARGFKMLWMVVVVFLICWSPYFILIFYSSIHRYTFPREVKAVTTLLTFLNSALNPFLYGFLNAKFRSTLKGFLEQKLWFCNWRKGRETPVYHIN